MWNLTQETDGKRTYTNSVTGSKCTTTRIYIDREGNPWYAFDDMMQIPFTRQFAATKISSLYQLGLSRDDLSGHISGLKTILKTSDPEKYEKAFALVLDFETKALAATDAVKQMSSLVCVYYMLTDEPIDSFDGSLQIRKMSILEADPQAHAFFLSRQIEDIEAYTQHLKALSQIVSPTMTELQDLSP